MNRLSVLLRRRFARRREGSILIICAGVLAVLMMFGATLALLARVEVRASRNYQFSQYGNQAAQALLLYASTILYQDKFGADGVPYNYDGGTDYADTAAKWVDENYDAMTIEQWLVNYGTWQSAAFGPANVWTAPDWKNGSALLTHGLGTDLPNDVRVRFALALFDVGAVLSVNDCGNLSVGGTDQGQNEGVSSFEISLEKLLGQAGAQAIIRARQGNAPGDAGDDDPAIPNPLVSPLIDNDGDRSMTDEADADAATPGYQRADEPQEFRTERPVLTGNDPDSPFGVYDLEELVVQQVLKGAGAPTLTATDLTRAGSIIKGTTAPSMRGDSSTRQPLFSPYVSNWAVPGLNVWADEAALTRNGPAILRADDGALAAELGMLVTGTPPQVPTTGAKLLVKRRPVDLFTTANVDRVFLLLDAVTPVQFIKIGGANVPAGELRNCILRQTAANLCDFVDTDDTVTVYTDTSVTPSRTFYGVEKVPYIVEMGCGIYVDAADGHTKAVGYIKLVNPWDTAVSLDGFSVNAAWTVMRDLNGGDDAVDSDGDGNPGPDPTPFTDVGTLFGGNLAFAAGLTIPARGILVITPDEAQLEKLIAGTPRLTGYVSAALGTVVDLGVAPGTALYRIRDVKAELKQNGVVIQPFARDNYVGGGYVTDAGYFAWDDTALGGVTLRLTDQNPTPITANAGAGTPRPIWPDCRPCYVAADGTVRTGPTAAGTVYLPWLFHIELDAATGNPALTDARPFTYNKEWTTGVASYARGDGWQSSPTPAISETTPETAEGASPTNYGQTKLNLWGSFPLTAFHPSDKSGNFTTWQVMNLGAAVRNIGYIGFVHTGIPWCTLGFTENVEMAGFPPGTGDVVCGTPLLEYLIAPTSPYEDGFDNDGDGQTDSADTGRQNADRAGPEIRVRGQVNVNNASVQVLRALFSQAALEQYSARTIGPVAPDTLRASLAAALVSQRTQAPFTTVGEVLRRCRGATAADAGNILHPVGDWSTGESAPLIKNTFAAEQTARALSNLVTVRSDQYMVLARVQVYRAANPTDPPTANPAEIYGERVFVAVLDRSYDPIRVLLFRWLTD